MPSPKHYLVTGAAGFIGSHLVARLLDAGHRVLGLDNLSTGSRGNLPGGADAAADRFELLVGDAAGRLAGPASLPGPPLSGIFHLAASVGVARVVADPTGCAENNLDQTRAALALARRTGAALLLASSSEVYGKCPVLPAREDADLVFGPTTSARWSYGLAKALDEHLALDAARRDGGRVVVARLFNAIGPGQLGLHGMVLPRFVEAAATGADLVVHGDGRQTRCFCDARDTAAALARLLGPEADHRGVFNVGSDRPIAIADLASLVRERAVAAGLPGGRIVHRPHAEVFGRDFEDTRERVPDLGRLRAATGWSPAIGLADTIDELLRLRVAASAAPEAGVA